MDPVTRYIELALAPDIEGLTRLVEQTSAELGSVAYYDHLVRAALVEVGARWERDELTVGDEHLITALTEQLLADRSRRHAGSSHVAVAACTPDNRHRVGLLIVADVIAQAGWQPILLGAQTPIMDVGRLARERGAELIMLSVGLESELDRLTDDLEELRGLVDDGVAIVVGGGPLARRPDWTPPGHVVACASAAEAHAEAVRLLPQVGTRA